MQSSLSKVEPGASGFGGVPGYIKPAGMAAIVTHLRDRCGMRSKGSIFCDIGCGEARPVMAAMEACPRIGGAIGFEVDNITLAVARRNVDRFTRLKWDGERYTTGGDPPPFPPFCLLQADVTRLEDLGCVTHAYSFCNGMPPSVLKQLFRVCASTESLRYVVLVYKKQGGDLANDLVEELRKASSSFYAFTDEKGRSLLQMPGQTAHGCCVRMSKGTRRLFLEAGDPPGTPLQSLNGCFSNPRQ